MTRRITVRSGSIPRKVVPPASVASVAGVDTDAIHDNVDGEIVLIDEKVSPVGADVLVIEDSEASDAKKRVQITNLPGGADADAIHDNVDAEISAIAAKGSPDGSDFLLIEDAAASNAKKRITIGDLPDTSDHATPIATHAGLPNAHHDESHDIASHSDTTATGAELETLTDGSETALHSHAGGGGASTLDDLTDVDTSGVSDGDILGYSTGSESEETIVAVDANDYFAGNPPELAIDGNSGTWWTTASTVNTGVHWISIDLGVAKTVSTFEVEQSNDPRFSTSYKIYWSDNNSTWSLIETFSGLTAGTMILTLGTPSLHRYFKIEENSSGFQYLRIQEIRAYSVTPGWFASDPTTLTDPIEMAEISAPSAPSADMARLYIEDNGSGKTRLMVLFQTGAAQQIAIEP